MTVHVYPVDDWIEHEVGVPASECKCTCRPTVEWIDADGVPYDHPIVIHNAVDGRE